MARVEKWVEDSARHEREMAQHMVELRRTSEESEPTTKVDMVEQGEVLASRHGEGEESEESEEDSEPIIKEEVGEPETRQGVVMTSRPLANFVRNPYYRK